MRRVFYEKDQKFDYLFVLVNPQDNAEIYKVRNFTDEMGHEYVYTLVGERRALTDEKLVEVVNVLPNGKFKNHNGTNDLLSALESLESIIESRSLNKDENIYIYFRKK